MNFKACPFTRRRACKARASKPRRRPSRPSYISRSRLPVRRRLIDRPRPRSTAADRLLEREGPPRHDMPCGSVAGAGVGGVGLGRRPAPAVPAACVRRATPCGSRGRPREVRAVATSPDNLSPRRRASISHRPVCFRHPPRTCHACTRNRRAWRSPIDLVGQSRHTRDTFVRRLPWLTRRRPRLFRRSFAEESSRTVYAPPRTALRPAVRDEVAVVIFLLSFSFFALRQSACRVERRGWVGTVVRPPARLSRVGFQAPAAWSRPDVFVSPRRQQRPTLP